MLRTCFFLSGLGLLLLGAGGLLWGQMTPSAPVKNFKLPRFGDEGFTQWVLQGERGMYDSEAQVRVKTMALRVYSGDERMLKELTLESPAATIRIQENRAFSDQAIAIMGNHFMIEGTGWEWLGDERRIVVEAATKVDFEQTITGGIAVGPEASRRTTIRSERLDLKTEDTGYEFTFTGGVAATSGDWNLLSKRLVALADAPAAEGPGTAAAPGQLDSLRQITASEEVVFRQGERTVRAGEARFFTDDRRVVLQGRPSIEVAGAYVTGERVESRAGEVVIEGSPTAGRAQMILLETGGLGLGGQAALSSETIVLADHIRLEETPTAHQFYFDGAVEVFSGSVQLEAAQMEVATQRVVAGAAGAAAAGDGGGLELGRVVRMEAYGGVRIEQGEQVATGERVSFHPDESRAVLTGNPRVTNGAAVVVGHRMELQPQLAVVRGEPEAPLRVELPQLPDLGYQPWSEAATETTVDADAPVEPVATVIRSQLLNMVETSDSTLFRFTGDVRVDGTNLQATCQRMDVVTVPEDSSLSRPDLSSGSAGAGLAVLRIEAYEALRIEQEGRTAEADRGTILPREGKLVLEQNAVVNDPRGTVRGHRLTLLQGRRRAIVEGGGPEGERARITLPGLSEGTF